MTTPSPFHIVYRPGDIMQGLAERVIGLIVTDDPTDVTLQLRANPGSIALQLYALDLDEALAEARELGFSH
jgi:hypothetical protein